MTLDSIQERIVASIQSIPFHFLYQSLIIILGLAYGYHFFFVTATPNEPPLIRGSIPFLGIALDFLWDPEKLLMKYQRRFGDIYTLYIAGQKMHVVTDPINAIPAVFRNFKTYSFKLLATRVDISLFGVDAKQATDPGLYKDNLDILAPHLLSQSSVEFLITRFNYNLRLILPREIEKLDSLGRLGKEGVVIDLVQWMKKVMFECSGKSLFGDTWPDDDEFYNDYEIYEEGIYPILKGLPPIFVRKSVQARERYYLRLLKMFKQGLKNPSKVIEERLRVQFSHGYSLEDSVRNMIGVAFALQTNAIPSAIWLIGYIACLAQQRQPILDQISQYVVAEESKPNSVAFNVSQLIQDPLLNSALSETLRLQVTGLTVRGVDQDATLTVNGRPYELRQGSMVCMPMACVHKDPEIYENPEEYQSTRFIQMHSKGGEDYKEKPPTFFSKNGIPVRSPLIVWGGGHFMCTGRKFAAGEIILFASSILHQFEILSVDGKEPPLPKTPPISKYGFGAEFPGGPWIVRIRYRQSK